MQRWVDPFFDLEQFHTKGPVEDELTKEAESDEEERRIASERLLHDIMQPKWIEKEVLDGNYHSVRGFGQREARKLPCVAMTEHFTT